MVTSFLRLILSNNIFNIYSGVDYKGQRSLKSSLTKGFNDPSYITAVFFLNFHKTASIITVHSFSDIKFKTDLFGTFLY